MKTANLPIPTYANSVKNILLQTEDLKPKKLDGIAVYSRMGAKAILEYMNYQVTLL